MRRENYRKFLGAFGCLGAFALWTLGVCFADVQTIGPRGSAVGFAAMNRFVHTLTGVNMALYTITDWLGLVPIGVALGFAVLGLTQWIRRKDIRKVDADILLLGGFYIVVIGAYLFFENQHRYPEHGVQFPMAFYIQGLPLDTHRNHPLQQD